MKLLHCDRPYITLNINNTITMLITKLVESLQWDIFVMWSPLFSQLTFSAWLGLVAGFFAINVSDPSYPDQPLFEYDVGVHCPRRFSLYFYIQTIGPDNYAKRMRVEITDTFRTINMMVFKPAPNMTKETYGKSVRRDSHTGGGGGGSRNAQGLSSLQCVWDGERRPFTIGALYILTRNE